MIWACQLRILHHKMIYSAFTLVEMLLVLGIASLLISLPMLQVRQWQERVRYYEFITEFEHRLIQTQQAAMITRKASRIIAQKDSQTVYFTYVHINGEFLKEALVVPAAIRVQRDVNLAFTARTGTVNQGVSIRFETPYHKEHLTYAYGVGSGQFVIQEK